MPTPSSRTHVLFSIVSLVCSLALAIVAGEVILHVKNSSMILRLLISLPIWGRGWGWPAR
jgi:hypothetical protein